MKNQNKIFGGILLVAIVLMGLYFNQKSLPQQTEAFATITLIYSDGTEYTFPRTTTYTMSFINPNTNLQVVGVRAEMYVTATYVGQLQSYRVQGSGQGQLFDGDTSVYLQELWTQPFDFSGSYLPSSQTIVVMSSTVSVSTLQSMYYGWIDGHFYRYDVWSPTGVTVTITFTNGATNALTVIPTRAQWRFYYRP